MAQLTDQSQKDILISYLTLRKLLGFLGILLPVALAIGTLAMHCHIQSSISAYYYSPMRDWFVGILCAMGIFLFTYTGYIEGPEVRIKENWLTKVAGVLAIIIANLPTGGDKEISKSCSTHSCPIPTCANVMGWNLDCASPLLGGVHLVCAALFFTILAYILYYKFSKINPSAGREEEIRFYKGCGLVMAVCILIMLVNEALSWKYQLCYPLYYSPVLFFFETIALFAFGIAWLRKGKIQEDFQDLKVKAKRLLAK
jgi:hypothetical protein